MEFLSRLRLPHIPEAMAMKMRMTVIMSGTMDPTAKPAARQARYRRTGEVAIRLMVSRAMRSASLLFSISRPINMPHMHNQMMGESHPLKTVPGSDTPVTT